MGILLIILSSALDGVWWTMFIGIFCGFLPVPNKLASKIVAGRRQGDFMSGSENDWMNARILESGYFFTALMIVTSLALPIIFYHAQMITTRSAILAFVGAFTIDTAILLYTKYFHHDEDEAYYFN